MLEELKKQIIVPDQPFEAWLERFDWTYHQLARNEYPGRYENLREFQLGCICDDPVLWSRTFLKDPDQPEKPWEFWAYQAEGIRHKGNALYKCGAEVGKTREIIAYILWKAFTIARGSGLVTAPQLTHLIEIIDAIEFQLNETPILGKSLFHHRKFPHHQLRFNNGFTVDFRPTGHDGTALRGVHVKTFALMDEAAKAHNAKIWNEFWRARKPQCITRIYSVPDGRRDTVFYRLGNRLEKQEEQENHGNSIPKTLNLRIFQWAKTLMPPPFWTDSRDREYITLYGGKDSAGYQHNILGEDGDPENSVFPWEFFVKLLKDIPEYTCLKIIVDKGKSNVYVKAYKIVFEQNPDEDKPTPREKILLEEIQNLETFSVHDLVNSVFTSFPGTFFGCGDFGHSPDPTEFLVKQEIGKTHKLAARVHMKGVTYDQQAAGLDALDNIFDAGRKQMPWGTDSGNAGSAVLHNLHSQIEIAGKPATYKHKKYQDRASGYQFATVYDAVNEEGEVLKDKKTGKEIRKTAKELSTDILVQKMQKMELEYPFDPDIITFYPGHTFKQGTKHRIFSGTDDHIIDADRGGILAKILNKVNFDWCFSPKN